MAYLHAPMSWFPQRFGQAMENATFGQTIAEIGLHPGVRRAIRIAAFAKRTVQSAQLGFRALRHV